MENSVYIVNIFVIILLFVRQKSLQGFLRFSRDDYAITNNNTIHSTVCGDGCEIEIHFFDKFTGNKNLFVGILLFFDSYNSRKRRNYFRFLSMKCLNTCSIFFVAKSDIFPVVSFEIL